MAGDSDIETIETDETDLVEDSKLYDSSEVSAGPEAELYEESAAPELQELMENATSEPSDHWDDIDFSTTANTPYEQSLIQEMDESGEIDIPEVDPNLEDPEFGRRHLPTENSGSFEGERGNSAFVPDSQEARDAMAEYGETSVEYVDGEPDFSPFTEHETPYGRLDCEVEIGHMTPNRQNPTWEYGDRRPAGASHDANYDLGNFAQGDNALVDKAIEEDQSLIEGLTPEEERGLRANMAKAIESWRTSNRLTWHECQDGKTMQLVPTDIHDACRHSGGVSVTRTLQAYGDERLDY